MTRTPSRQAADGAPERARAGAAPVWLVGGVLLAGLAWAAGGLLQSVRARGYTTVDPSRISIEGTGARAGTPAQWTDHLAAKLAQLGELSTLDDELLAKVTAEIAGLPYVIEVGDAQVVWPDGVTVRVRLREPVACIRTGEDFLTVAADGVVLPGYWTGPPDFGLGLLPVIGPNDGAFDLYCAGDQLEEERHLEALSVAVSMRDFLSPGDLEALGPVLIDSSLAHLASVTEPGTRLFLEDRRFVLYGRTPRAGVDGELPEETKWAHLLLALGYLYLEEPIDWDMVDIRWDDPTLRRR